MEDTIILRLVPYTGFSERKADALEDISEDNGIDREFGSLIVDINGLPFAYTSDSCFGKFGNGSHRLRKNSRMPLGYGASALRIGLDYYHLKSKEFLLGVCEIVNRHLGYAHILDTKPLGGHCHQMNFTLEYFL